MMAPRVRGALYEIILDVAQGASMADEGHQPDGFVDGDPAVFRILAVQPNRPLGLENGDEDGNDLDAVFFRVVELIAGVGRIEPVRDQHGLLADFAQHRLRGALLRLDGSGNLAPEAGEDPCPAAQ